MALSYGFYNSSGGDRRYNAEQISSIFNYLITEGVLASVGKHFGVVPGQGRQVIVQTGWAWFNSSWTNNDSDMPLNLEAPDISVDRIDAVIIETNKNLDVRANTIKIITGVPSSSPQKPAMANTTAISQHPVAYVTVHAGMTSVSLVDIEIVVGKDECPFITSILQSTSIEVLFNQWEGEFDAWFQHIQTVLSEEVVTNLYAEIDKRVKIEDKATEADAIAGTSTTKWMTPATTKAAVEGNRDEIGQIRLAAYDISKIDSTYHKCDGSTLKNEALFEKLKFHYGFPEISQSISFSDYYSLFKSGGILLATSNREGDFIFIGVKTNSYSGTSNIEGYRIRGSTMSIEPITSTLTIASYGNSMQAFLLGEYNGVIYFSVNTTSGRYFRTYGTYKILTNNTIVKLDSTVSAFNYLDSIVIGNISYTAYTDDTTWSTNVSESPPTAYGYIYIEILNMETDTVTSNNIKLVNYGKKVYMSHISGGMLGKYLYVTWTYSTTYAGTDRVDRYTIDITTTTINSYSIPNWANNVMRSSYFTSWSQNPELVRSFGKELLIIPSVESKSPIIYPLAYINTGLKIEDEFVLLAGGRIYSLSGNDEYTVYNIVDSPYSGVNYYIGGNWMIYMTSDGSKIMKISYNNGSVMIPQNVFEQLLKVSLSNTGAKFFDQKTLLEPFIKIS